MHDLLITHYLCTLYLIAPRNGDHDLNWFEVGRIPVNESTGLFFFEYFNNESVTNLWPGQQLHVPHIMLLLQCILS